MRPSAPSTRSGPRADVAVSSAAARTLSYLYAVLRVVPRVEREEFINVGVVVFSRPGRFLGVKTCLHADKLRALAPTCDHGLVEAYLQGIEAVAAGQKDAGPMAGLDLSERFHWIAAPSNTIIQPSPVHPGLTTDPAATLDHLFATLVR